MVKFIILTVQSCSNTEIDIWHANDAGEYDNIGYNLRGKTITNSQGFYVFSIKRFSISMDQHIDHHTFILELLPQDLAL